MQKHSFYLTKFLVKLGVDVTLVHCVGSGDTLIPHQRVLNVMHLEDTPKFKSICLQFPRPDWMPGHYIKESYKYSTMTFETIEGELKDFDFIYAKGFSAWHLIDQKQKGLAAPPVGVKFHGYEMFQPPASFKSRFEHMLLRGPVKFNNINADYVFSYGGKITPIVSDLGIPAENIIEIPTGIESNWCIEKIAPEEGKRNFLFLGRYERRKGIEELNAVLKQILSQEDFRFHFIGPIPDKHKITSDKVIYHGKIMEKERIQEIMAKCQILVTPSHSEGMPNVIMEGMSRGLAPIATDVGAVQIQVNNSCGWLIPPADSTALKKAMIEAIHMDQKTLDHKRNSALNRVRDNFTWETVSSNTLAELQRLIIPA